MGPVAGLGCITSPGPSPSLLKFKNEKAQINICPTMYQLRKTDVGMVVAVSLRERSPRKEIGSV
jgi:hypothetical protein